MNLRHTKGQITIVLPHSLNVSQYSSVRYIATESTGVVRYIQLTTNQLHDCKAVFKDVVSSG
jgi:hypothetical protein